MIDTDERQPQTVGRGGVAALTTFLAVLTGLLSIAILPVGQAGASAHSDGINPRVIGGNVAAEGSWPSQAALLIASEPFAPWAQFCGGTLIDPDWVLTAAHCVTDDSGAVAPASAVEVAIGINDLRNIAASDRIDLVSIRVIPGWNPATYDWDFALLELATPSGQPVTELIAPGQESLTEGGDPAAVAGWGCTSQTAGSCNSGGYPNELLEADVSFVSDALCGGGSSYGAGFDPASMICAGNYATGLPDTCFGDSGGPLVAFGPGDVPVLAGITSWGRECALPNYPGVYSRVLAGREWILRTIGDVFGLTVSRAGTGEGTVTSDPAGIDCGTSCSADFVNGTTVELTAAADSGSTFTGWSGACSGTGACEVTMDQAREVIATFTANTPPPVAPTVTITGKPPIRTSNTVATFRFRASQSGSTFSCRLDGAAWRRCTSPTSYRRLARGRTHSFLVRATRDGLTGPITVYRWFIKRR